MDNIPTAEEYAHEYFKHTLDSARNKNRERGEVLVKDYLIDFAKMHVKAALKAASNRAEAYNKAKFAGDFNPQVDMDSILKSYPESNIK